MEKNYLITDESYGISKISRMLNNQTPIAHAAIVHDRALAKEDLVLAFITAKETLNHRVLMPFFVTAR